MKRYITFILAVLLCFLSGCTATEKENGAVRFYYRQADLSYNTDGAGVIGSESRDLSMDREDLGQLLALYFRGPLDQTLRSPFLSGTKVIEFVTVGDTLVLTLDTVPSQGIDWTVACTCLAMTCLELTDAEQVQIDASYGSTAASTIISRDSLILSDTLLSPTEPANS